LGDFLLVVSFLYSIIPRSYGWWTATMPTCVFGVVFENRLGFRHWK
jgi:hypothetical protein